MGFVYKVTRENAVNGSRGDDVRIYHSERQLKVGKLYLVLPGLQGGFRVLDEIEGDDVQCRK